MAVRILNRISNDAAVKVELVVQTIERNRDRIRGTCTSLVTASGMLITLCTASILFVDARGLLHRGTAVLFGGAIACFISSASIAVFSGALRKDYAVSSEAQFVTDLLKIFTLELWLSRAALALALCALLLMLSAVASVLRY